MTVERDRELRDGAVASAGRDIWRRKLHEDIAAAPDVPYAACLQFTWEFDGIGSPRIGHAKSRYQRASSVATRRRWQILCWRSKAITDLPHPRDFAAGAGRVGDDVERARRQAEASVAWGRVTTAQSGEFATLIKGDLANAAVLSPSGDTPPCLSDDGYRLV